MTKGGKDGKVNQLRKQAEATLSQIPPALRKIAPDDIERAMHELQVHQIELEIQNEELKRAQLDLEEARDKYQNLYDLAPTGYFSLARSGLILDANLSGRELLGIIKRRLTGTKFTSYISSESQDAFYLHLRDVLKTGIKGNCELQMLKANGASFPAQLISLAVLEKDGAINQCRTAVIDITERKKWEDNLKESEGRYRDLFEGTFDMVQSVAADGRFIFVNRAWRETMGYSEAEIANLNLFQIIHPESLPHCRGLFSRVISGEPVRDIKTTFIARDGKLVDLEGSATARRVGGKVVATHGFFRDVTESKRAEARLQESEEQFRTLVNNVRSGVFRSTSEGKGHFIEVNPAMEKITGYSREELLGMPIEDLYVIPAERKRAIKAWTEDSGLCLTMIWRRKDGTLITVQQSVSTTKDARGNIVYFDVVMEDVTERKRAQEALTTSEARFRTVARLSSDFAYSCVPGSEGEYKVDWITDAFYTLSGYSETELLEKGCWMFVVHPDDQGMALERMHRLKRGQSDTREFRIVTRAGRVLDIISYMECHADPERPGGLRIIGAVKEITESKQAEDTLRKSEIKYHSLFETMPSGVAICQPVDGGNNFVITAFNQAAEKMENLDRTKVIGQKITDVFPGVQDMGLFEVLQRVAKTGKPEYLSASIYKDARNTGSYRENWVYKQPNGEIVSVYNDITERKRAQEEIQRHYDTQLVTNKILSLSLEDLPLQTMLQRSLEFVLSIPWLALKQKGAIFLVEKDQNVLVMKAQSNLAEPIRKACTQVPFGKCICGRAALTQKTQFTDCLDERHEVRYEGITPHGHYCVPIMSGGKLLGVLNTYTAEGHRRDKKEEAFLTGIADVLAGITERKLMEKAALENRELFRSFIDSATDGFSLWDKDFRLIEISRVAMERYGYTDKQSIIGKTHEELMPIIEETKWNESYLEVMRTGRPLLIEEALIPTPKGNRYLTLRAFKVGDGLGIIGTDITERKRAEESLMVNEIKYRTLFELQPTGITVSDDAGNIKESNKTAERLLGLSREIQKQRQIAGHEWEIIRPDGSPMPADEYASVRALKENRVIENVEMGIVKGEGVVTWINVTAVPLPLPGYGVIITYNDITERKLMEKAVLESRELFRSFIDSASDGFSLWDKDFRLIENSRAARDRYGYTDKQALIGKNLADIVPFADAAKHIKFLRGVIRTGNPRLIEDAIVHTPRGARHLTIRAFKVGDGLGLIGTDITERLENEQKLAEQARELARANETRLELERKAQINNRLVSIGEMAAGIAHEINNPLTPILGFADMLLEKDLPEDVKADIEVIRDSARRTADVTKRLLIFARQGKPLHTVCDINEVVASTLQIRAYHLKTGGINVTTEFDPELPRTMADNSQLQQVVLNLIMNAEYSMARAHKGGNLLVKTETKGNIIRLTVKDDGPGISKEHMERLFEPFFTTKPTGEGTGLGLSVCHGIIAEHNGKIHVESKAGKGAAFIVELPIIKPEGKGAEEARLSESTTPKSIKARILVVDDEPSIVRVLKRVLTGEGYEVEHTAKARKAQTLIKERAYDLILLDIKLPDMSGIELYKHLKKTAKSTTQRIIFITGDVMGTDTMDFFSRSGALYITKPFDVELLKREVKNKLLREDGR